MAPPSAMASILTVFTLLISATAYTNHTVGGAAGWFFNDTGNSSAVNYTAWASSQTFNLGDYLIFNTDSNHTVIQTYNLTTYESCTADDSDNGTFIYDSGDANSGEKLTIPVPLTIEGPNYYFSDADDGVQCLRGMAFEINVNRGNGLPPSLNQPPPPPYIEPPGPDTPQSPPITVTRSPTLNGGFADRANVRLVVFGLFAALIFFFF